MAIVAKDAIRIDGLKELQAALKRVDGETQKQLRVVFNDAVEIIAADARRKVPSRSGRARASVKAQSGQREAKVVGGSKRVPYYPWLDFGGKVGRDRSVTRRWEPDGRYLYPSWRRNRDEVHKALEAGLTKVIRSVGWDVDHG